MISRRCRLGSLVVLAIIVSSCGSGSGSTGSVSPSRASPSSSASPTTPALGADWPEYHRDGGRAGVGPALPALGTPAVAWTAGLDGDVYASPLIVAGQVLAATENNSTSTRMAAGMVAPSHFFWSMAFTMPAKSCKAWMLLKNSGSVGCPASCR